jgi:hypothetical protein
MRIPFCTITGSRSIPICSAWHRVAPNKRHCATERPVRPFLERRRHNRWLVVLLHQCAVLEETLKNKKHFYVIQTEIGIGNRSRSVSISSHLDESVSF